MRKQMKEASDSFEMRGAFANGWLSAEAAHNNRIVPNVGSGIKSPITFTQSH
jgi:hypothetical protein